MCLTESCIPDCWKVSLVVVVFEDVGERSTAKNYCPISLLSVVSKVFEKLVNNRIIYIIEINICLNGQYVEQLVSSHICLSSQNHFPLKPSKSHNVTLVFGQNTANLTHRHNYIK